MSKAEGLGKVHVITGPGKGKTSAAFGLAMRAAGHGLRVCIVQFMKTGETTGEVISSRKLRNIKIAQFGTGRFVPPSKPSEQDRRCASEALDHAKQLLRERSCELLVLDEVSVAVDFGLIGVDEVLELLRKRPQGIEFVLTGRNAPREFIDCADYVSYIDAKKHPFDRGLKARKGIEW